MRGEYPYLYNDSTHYIHWSTLERVTEIAPSHPPTTDIYVKNFLKHGIITVSPIPRKVQEALLGLDESLLMLHSFWHMQTSRPWHMSLLQNILIFHLERLDKQNVRDKSLQECTMREFSRINGDLMKSFRIRI